MKRYIPGLLFAFALVAQPAFAGSATDTLGKIKSDKSITIAYSSDSLPFSFSEDGKPAGYSVDLCRAIVENLEAQTGIEEIKIEWKAANTPERIAMVAEGTTDMECGTTSITLGRQEKVDFSNETFVESAGVLVLDKSGIQGLMSLGDKKVAVIPGTTTAKRLAEALDRKHVSAKMVDIENARDGIDALTAKKVDAYAGDRLTLAGQVAQSKDPTIYAMLGQEFSIDPYGLALPRGDADFRLAVNSALAEIYRTGTIVQIFSRWFPDAEPSDILQIVYLLNAYPD